MDYIVIMMREWLIIIMSTNKIETSDKSQHDIRLIIPIFLLKKLQLHPLTKGLYPVSLGHSLQESHFQIKQENSQRHFLIYCQSGQATLIIKGKSKNIKRGDLVIISPRQSFHYHAKTKSGHQAYWINFTGVLADDFAERLLMKMDDGTSHVGILNNIIADFDNLLELGQRGYTATNVIHAVHVLQQALSFLALQLRLAAFNTSSNFDLEAVETLMRNNLHQELNLDTLAHYSQLSKFHFAKKFKELTDTSPIQHFINMKIQQACIRLNNSADPIKNIAEELGYGDPYYFSRLFKKTVGMSPKQYRDSGHN